MGNLCIREQPTGDDFWYKITCYKCNDNFYSDKIGIYSQRKSCRFHDFNEKGICKNCHSSEMLCASGCFHVKKRYWYSFITG